MYSRHAEFLIHPVPRKLLAIENWTSIDQIRHTRYTNSAQSLIQHSQASYCRSDFCNKMLAQFHTPNLRQNAVK